MIYIYKRILLTIFVRTIGVRQSGVFDYHSGLQWLPLLEVRMVGFAPGKGLPCAALGMLVQAQPSHNRLGSSSAGPQTD